MYSKFLNKTKSNSCTTLSHVGWVWWFTHSSILDTGTVLLRTDTHHHTLFPRLPIRFRQICAHKSCLENKTYNTYVDQNHTEATALEEGNTADCLTSLHH